MTTPYRTHLRWWICAIVFFATAIIYSDRQFLSLLKSTIGDEIHWTDTQFGSVSSWFLGAYAVGVLFFGRFIDRVGVKIGYATTVALWSLAALSHTLVHSVEGFIAARVFLGLSEAGNFPAAIKAIAQWFPRAERAFATALFNSGSNVGAIVAPFLVAWLLKAGFTWHAPFFIAGGAGVIWVVVWWLFYSTPETHKFLSAEELALIRSDPVSPEESAPAVSWFSLFRFPQAWSFFVAKFLTDPVWFFLLFLAARLFQEDAPPRHQGELAAPDDDLRRGDGAEPDRRLRAGLSRPARLERDARAQDGAVLLCRDCGADSVCRRRGRLDGGADDRRGRRGASSVVGQSLHHRLGHVPALRDRLTDRHRDTFGATGSMMFIYLCGHILDIYGVDHAQAGYFVLFAYASFAYLVAFGLQHLLAPKFEPVMLHAKTS